MGDKIVVKMTFIANFSLPTFQNISAVHASLALQKIVYKLKEPAYCWSAMKSSDKKKDNFLNGSDILSKSFILISPVILWYSFSFRTQPS